MPLTSGGEVRLLDGITSTWGAGSPVHIGLYDNVVDWSDPANPTPAPHEPTWAGYARQTASGWVSAVYNAPGRYAITFANSVTITYGGGGSDPDVVGFLFFLDDGTLLGGSFFIAGTIVLVAAGQPIVLLPQATVNF
jgi:hypothetical protein